MNRLEEISFLLQPGCVCRKCEAIRELLPIAKAVLGDMTPREAAIVYHRAASDCEWYGRKAERTHFDALVDAVQKMKEPL